MTMQIADTVDLEGEAFRLVGYHHRDEDKNLLPPAVARPARPVLYQQLLAWLLLRLRRRRRPAGAPPLPHRPPPRARRGRRSWAWASGGSAAGPSGSPAQCFWSWNGLAEPLDFTGKLVVGLEYPNEPNAVGGYLCWRNPVEAPALHELYFDRGELIARVDLGAAAAAIRTRLQQEEHETRHRPLARPPPHGRRTLRPPPPPLRVGLRPPGRGARALGRTGSPHRRPRPGLRVPAGTAGLRGPTRSNIVEPLRARLHVRDEQPIHRAGGCKLRRVDQRGGATLRETDLRITPHRTLGRSAISLHASTRRQTAMTVSAVLSQACCRR